MWQVSLQTITMAEGDFGLTLPITVNGTTLSSADRIHITIKKEKNGEVVIEREMTPIENTVNFELDQDDTELLPAGRYVYSLDWYRSGSFMCNIVPCAVFRVVDKA